MHKYVASSISAKIGSEENKHVHGVGARQRSHSFWLFPRMLRAALGSL